MENLDLIDADIIFGVLGNAEQAIRSLTPHVANRFQRPARSKKPGT